MCQAKEGMLPQRGANLSAASVLSYSETLMSVVYLKSFDFFLELFFQMLYTCHHPTCFGLQFWESTLGAPEPREDEGLTQATHGFVGEGPY